jgi:hypothetical protein
MKIFLGNYLDFALTIHQEYLVLIFARKERLPIEEMVVNRTQTEHVALDSQPCIFNIPYLKNLRRHKPWSSTPHEQIVWLVY